MICHPVNLAHTYFPRPSRTFFLWLRAPHHPREWLGAIRVPPEVMYLLQASPEPAQHCSCPMASTGRLQGVDAGRGGVRHQHFLIDFFEAGGPHQERPCQLFSAYQFLYGILHSISSSIVGATESLSTMPVLRSLPRTTSSALRADFRPETTPILPIEVCTLLQPFNPVIGHRHADLSFCSFQISRHL